MSQENRDKRKAKRKARRAARKPPFRPLDEKTKAALEHLLEVANECLDDGDLDLEDVIDITEAALEVSQARRESL